MPPNTTWIRPGSKKSPKSVLMTSGMKMAITTPIVGPSMLKRPPIRIMSRNWMVYRPVNGLRGPGSMCCWLYMKNTPATPAKTPLSANAISLLR